MCICTSRVPTLLQAYGNLLKLQLLSPGGIPQRLELMSNFPNGSGLLCCKGVVKTRNQQSNVCFLELQTQPLTFLLPPHPPLFPPPDCMPGHKDDSRVMPGASPRYNVLCSCSCQLYSNAKRVQHWPPDL